MVLLGSEAHSAMAREQEVVIYSKMVAKVEELETRPRPLRDAQWIKALAAKPRSQTVETES